MLAVPLLLVNVPSSWKEFIGTTTLCIQAVVSDYQVYSPNLGAPSIPNDYQCNSMDLSCKCPYAPEVIQTFETYTDYKKHMQDFHNEGAYTKRKYRVPMSDATKEKKRIVTARLHEDGIFRNTHIKREILLEFVDIYDHFLTDLFKSDEYDGGKYEREWSDWYRIRAVDLEERDLKDIIIDLKNGHFSSYAQQRMKWVQRALDENYERLE